MLVFALAAMRALRRALSAKTLRKDALLLKTVFPILAGTLVPRPRRLLVAACAIIGLALPRGQNVQAMMLV
jgi:hypothetical protein